MKFFKWPPHFDVNVESLVVLIWVSFPYLCQHLISPRILHGLGSLFGRSFRTDNATISGTRPYVARILVELDITKHYPNQVWLGSDSVGYIQSVEVEEFLPYCSHCKSLGHVRDVCPILFPNLGHVRDVRPPVVEGPSVGTHTLQNASDIPLFVGVDHCAGDVPLVDGGDPSIINASEQENIATLVEGDVNCLNSDNLVSSNVVFLESKYVNLIKDSVVEDCCVVLAPGVEEVDGVGHLDHGLAIFCFSCVALDFFFGLGCSGVAHFGLVLVSYGSVAWVIYPLYYDFELALDYNEVVSQHALLMAMAWFAALVTLFLIRIFGLLLW
ncbi:hypothetical protein KFK09_001529 [Dendrobium nobile]|uniref:DUF4283 domain-containing protein n=1 Tax=Dendrobium nobile TaxID=94219 RepID=A0A8T3C8F0_DENNO|nr:hypothetical protein KFK09_001529 [Dendrobium nobile]